MFDDKPMNNLVARVMYKMHSPKRLQKEISIIRSGVLKVGDIALDFGCGPGNLSVVMAEEVGEKGIVYALDIHPLALQKVRELCNGKGINNVKTILTNNFSTGLSTNSIDIVFIFNTLGMVKDKISLLKEVGRILKNKGICIIYSKMPFGKPPCFIITQKDIERWAALADLKVIDVKEKTYCLRQNLKQSLQVKKNL